MEQKRRYMETPSEIRRQNEIEETKGDRRRERRQAEREGDRKGDRGQAKETEREERETDRWKRRQRRGGTEGDRKGDRGKETERQKGDKRRQKETHQYLEAAAAKETDKWAYLGLPAVSFYCLLSPSLSPPVSLYCPLLSPFTALYRRALAKSSLGELSDAKDDLMAVIAIDKTNAEARKELLKIKEKIQAAKEEDKKRRGSLRNRLKLETSSPQGGLQRRKSKGDTSRSSSSSSSSSSVMEIDEEDAEIIKETKKMGYCYFRRDLTEEEKKLNAQNKPTKILSPSVSPQTPDGASGDIEKSPEGKSISQWNSKGTTYEEKDVSPWARTRFAERLQEASATCGGGNSSTAAIVEAGLVDLACREAMEKGKRGGVDEGFEMEKLIKECFCTTIETLKVGEVTGDAHLAVVRGSRRVFFDMKCSIEFKVCCCNKAAAAAAAAAANAPSEDKEAMGSFETKGTLLLPEVSSADGSGMSWLEGSSLRLSKSPPTHLKSIIDEAVEKYRESVAAKIQAFLDDCKALP
ncbi:hypothetical protein, conserved [Eimeria brunetti]|uniref:Activator of Hsp90 ATPase AHSA1-like N-terminal domain-containing protein n=1 Tax=Eimeria brunetti TaxID=51314 RepID=U6LJ51_9EIME|nr:hypothetical protein, conserved [Eimeria brunetti]